MVALEKRRRGIEDQSLEKFRNFRRYVVLTFVLFGIGWLVMKPVRQHEFDYSIFYNINRDPVGDPIGQPTLYPSNDHLRIGSKAMVSSDVPLCSTMGKEILQRGGNAADAGVTVALCIGSVNLHSSGIGGGGYIVSSLKEKQEVISIDARETAPQKAFKEMFHKSMVLSKVGGLAIGVPGELKGLYELYIRHGSGNLSWEALIEPVVELNKKGFKCSEILDRAIKFQMGLVFPFLPSLAEDWDFVFKNNTKSKPFIDEGDLITRPALADTLSMIAQNGSSDVFYDPNGPIVKSLIETSSRFGGIITAEDFSNYDVKVENALTLNFTVHNETYKVYTSGGVSSGLALLSGLNLYEKLGGSNDHVLQTHKIIECMKWMASARSNFGDFTLPTSNSTFREDLIKQYTSDKWAEHIITSGAYSDNNTFPWKHYRPKYELTEPHGTSHFSIIDSDDNTMAMTTTVNLVFGSMVYDNQTGIILNNEMDDFSIPGAPNAFYLSPSVYNYIEPFKRPLSSTSPTIIMSLVNDTFRPDLVIGAAGGSRITTAVFQAIVRILCEKLPLLEAIAYPRLHHQLIPQYIMVENLTVFELHHNITERMHELGHDFFSSGPLTAMNGIKRTLLDHDSQWHGVSDYWRKRGQADGY
ncbi:unnamed protein product [Debaryomyces tyrocola]|nr:unnamed protein product [Debaryomyces tyrocola]